MADDQVILKEQSFENDLFGVEVRRKLKLEAHASI
jgi:hypothetical protein